MAKGYDKINFDDLPDVLTPKDVEKILSCGRDQAYNLFKSEQFHVVRVGNQYKCFKGNFLKWLKGESA